MAALQNVEEECFLLVTALVLELVRSAVFELFVFGSHVLFCEWFSRESLVSSFSFTVNVVVMFHGMTKPQYFYLVYW